jgi:hypothetical protein
MLFLIVSRVRDLASRRNTSDTSQRVFGAPAARADIVGESEDKIVIETGMAATLFIVAVTVGICPKSRRAQWRVVLITASAC